MNRAALLLPLVLVGCASTDMRGRGAQAEAPSPRTVAELEACTALALSKAKPYEVRSSEKAGAAHLKLVMRITGVPAVIGAVDITDAGVNRRLVGYATGKATGAPVVTISDAVRTCAAGA